MLQIQYYIILMLSINLFTGCVSQSNPNLLNRGDLGKFNTDTNNKAYAYTVFDKNSTELTTNKELSKIVNTSPNGIVEQFYAKGGDCFGIDCEKDREGIEIAEIKRDNDRKEMLLNWNIYLPKNYIDFTPSGIHIGQIYRFNKRQPLWKFVLKLDGLYLSDRVYMKKNYQLIERIETSKWYNIKTHIKLSDNENGFMKVWINDKLVFNYKGVTSDGSKTYIRYGNYRSSIYRFKEKYDVKELHDQKIYYSDMRVVFNEKDLNKTK